MATVALATVRSGSEPSSPGAVERFAGDTNDTQPRKTDDSAKTWRSLTPGAHQSACQSHGRATAAGTGLLHEQVRRRPLR
jgi:hypothetical protein